MFLFISFVSGSGAYDHGTAAGKGNWDVSLTWNPFNYFEQGQSYVVLGYGLTNRFDIHGYYSYTPRGNDNYYVGFSFQFYRSKFLDLSTAVGIRKYIDESTTHLFFPQLLYTIHLTNKTSLGGSWVSIRDTSTGSTSSLQAGSVQGKLGGAVDAFLMVKIFENKQYKIDITVGAFNPVLWEPKGGDWYPTYSIDIKFKN